MVLLFLGMTMLWVGLGLVQIVANWGQPEQWRSALSSLLMALLNVAVAWYLYSRRERRTGQRR